MAATHPAPDREREDSAPVTCGDLVDDGQGIAVVEGVAGCGFALGHQCPHQFELEESEAAV